MALPDLLTTEDVANYLKVDVVTVRRLVKRGELSAYRVGNEFRFTEQDIRTFLEGQRTPNPMLRMLEVPGIPGMRINLRNVVMEERTPMGGMERFTQRARLAFSLAAGEALKRGEGEITPVHLLLALTLETNGIAQRVLNELAVSTDEVRALLPNEAESVAPDLPQVLSDDTKKTLERAIAEAKQLSHAYVDTGHVLLGLVSDAGMAETLQKLGVSAEQVREHYLRVQTGEDPE